MEISYLKEFVVLGESSSILAAAKKLNVVPSTLGRHLDAIEAELGFSLLNRTTTSFRLTREGETFLDQARDVISAYSAALSKTLETRQLEPEKVSIGGHMRIMSVASLISIATTHLMQQQQSLILEPYEVETHGSILLMSSNDPCDIARAGLNHLSLLVDDTLNECDGFMHELIYKEPFSLAIPVNNMPIPEGPVDLRDYSDYTFVIAPFYYSFHKRQISVCQEIGFEPNQRYKHFHSFGDMYTNRNNTEVFLLGARDAEKIPPPEISGLTHRALVNQEAYMNIFAVWSEKNNELLQPVLESLRVSAALLKKQPMTWTATPA